MNKTPRKRTRSSAEATIEKDSVNPDVERDGVGVVIPIESLKLPKKQPRRSFDKNKMEQLVESVRRFGILSPLIVRPLSDETYELVAGERRYRSAIELGLTEVPVVVRQMSEKESFELALLENLQRDDLNAIDETEGLLDLLCETLDLDRAGVVSLLNQAANAERRGQPLTDNVIRQIEQVDEIFLTVGRLNRESFRSNRLPLLNLPDDVLAFLRKGELEYTKAKAIAKLDDIKLRRELMRRVVKEGLSLTDVKRIVDAAMKGGDAPQLLDVKKELKSITRIKSAAWDNEGKQKKLKKLLAELRAVLQD